MAGKVSALRESGWLHAVFVAALAYPIGNTASRLVVDGFSAHPVAYAALSMLAAAIGLMIAAKPGVLGKETLFRPETWVYGVLNTLAFTLAVSVALYVSATQVSLLTCVPIVLVYLLSAAFLGHRVSLQEWLGLICISGAVIYLLGQVPLATVDLVQLCVLLLLLGLAQALQKIVAERHKTNRAAVTFHQNLRVTAVVMGVTSGMFIVVFLGLAYMQDLTQVTVWAGAPKLSDFIHWPMFVMALLIGLLMRAPSKYCEFVATKKITAKYFLAITAVQPLFTAIYETTLTKFGVMQSPTLNMADYMSMSVIILGSLLLALSGMKRGVEIKPTNNDFLLDPASNETVRHTVALTMTFAKGNKLKVAQLLGLELKTLKDILADKKGELQFTRELARRVQRHFADHVAMADPLTGLQNRLQFMTALTQKLKGKAPVNLVLIDLNKFKPVNDTYGHAAGDLVLQLVARRLKQLAPKNAVVARLGGDEFALFSTAAINTKALSAKLAVPYRTKYGSLTVTASLGMAQSGKDGKTPEALLSAADKRMYGQKR